MIEDEISGVTDLETIEDDICGETFDHDEMIIFEDEIVLQWECRLCGAEGWEYLDA